MHMRNIHLESYFFERKFKFCVLGLLKLLEMITSLYTKNTFFHDNTFHLINSVSTKSNGNPILNYHLSDNLV